MKLVPTGGPENKIPIAIQDHQIYELRPITAYANPDFFEASGFALASTAIFDEALPLLDGLDMSFKRCGPRSYGRKRRSASS